MSTTSQWWIRASGALSAGGAQSHSPQGGDLNGSTSDAVARGVISEAGTLKSFRFDLASAPGTAGSGKSFQAQVVLNGTPNATLSVTLTDLQTSGTATGSVAVSAGDTISILVTPTGTPNSVTAQFSTEFDPTTANNYSYPANLGNGSSLTSAAPPAYNRGLFGSSAVLTTDSLANHTRDLAPFAGTIKALYIALSGAPGSSRSWDFILTINGTEQAATAINIAGTNTTGNVTGLSVSVAAGDLIGFKVKAANGSPLSTRVGWGITLAPSTSGLFALCANDKNTSASVTHYLSVAGEKESSTEAPVQIFKAPAALQFKGLYAVIGTSQSTTSWTYRTRINTANGALTFTISSGTTGNDTSHTDTLAAGDVLSISNTVSGTTTTGNEAIGIAATTNTSVTETATATSTIPKLTSSAVGTMQPKAAATSTMPKLTAAAIAKQAQKATAASTMPKLSAAATAGDFVGLIITAASTLPKVTSQAVATEQPKAIAASALPKLSSAAIATEQPKATAASRLPMLTSAATASFVAPTVPVPQAVRFGYVQDRPQIVFDGTNLLNRIIPIGVNYDDSDLTLEPADPETRPFAIQSDGDTWYIEDAASVSRYGLFEKRVYWTDIKVPATHTNSQTGTPGQPTGANQELLTIGAPCTAGDTIQFVANGATYLYTFAASPGNGQIGIGASAYEQQALISAAFAGTDGHNVGGTWTLTSWYNNIATIGTYLPTSTSISISASFTSASNFLGGGVNGADPPQTSKPATAPTALGGGDAGVLTANVLYWRAVNELIRNRSEVLGFRCALANGGDIWALPGDRMHIRYRAIIESDDGRLLPINIDRPMVITERHDRSDPSGVRQVEFVFACPIVDYPIPAVPTWPDPANDPSALSGGDPPVSLPIPDASGAFPPTDDSYPGGSDPSGADAVADDIAKVATGNGLPYRQCCPSEDEITSGTGLGPPSASQPFTAIASTDNACPGVAGGLVHADANWVPTPRRAILVQTLASDGTEVRVVAGNNCVAERIHGAAVAAKGTLAGGYNADSFAFWLLTYNGDGIDAADWAIDTSVAPSGTGAPAFKLTTANPISAVNVIDRDEMQMSWGPQDGPYDEQFSVITSVSSEAGDGVCLFVNPGTDAFDSSQTLSMSFNGASSAPTYSWGLQYSNLGVTSMPATLTEEDINTHAPGAGGPTAAKNRGYMMLFTLRAFEAAS